MKAKSLAQIKIDLESSVYYSGDPEVGIDFYIGDGAFDEAREWLSKHRDKYNDLAELIADFANYTRQNL